MELKPGLSLLIRYALIWAAMTPWNGGT